MSKFHDGDLDIEFEPSVAALAACSPNGIHTNSRSSDVEFRGVEAGVKPVFPAGSVYAELAMADPSIVPVWPGSAHEAPKARATIPTPTSGAGAVEVFDTASEAAVQAFIKAEGGSSNPSGSDQE